MSILYKPCFDISWVFFDFIEENFSIWRLATGNDSKSSHFGVEKYEFSWLVFGSYYHKQFLPIVIGVKKYEVSIPFCPGILLVKFLYVES